MAVIYDEGGNPIEMPGSPLANANKLQGGVPSFGIPENFQVKTNWRGAGALLPGPDPVWRSLLPGERERNLRPGPLKPAPVTSVPNWMQDLLNPPDGSGVGGVSFQPIPAPRAATFTPSVVDRSLYALEQTAAEAQALADARADLDARARAGAQAIANTWQTVEQNNRAAAEKARALALQYGFEAQGLWTNAANQAREASVLRAAAAMANAGRAPIDLDPMSGGGAFIAAMESLVDPEARRAYTEGALQAERSDEFAAMAGRQMESYQAELTRTSLIMAADMAREHNARVLERIGRERLALSEAERQTDLFNRQMQAQIERENIERQFLADQFNAQQRQAAQQFNAQLRQAAAQSGSSFDALYFDVERAWALKDPQSLAAKYGMSLGEANQYIRNYDLSRQQAQGGGQGAPPVTGFSPDGT